MLVVPLAYAGAVSHRHHGCAALGRIIEQAFINIGLG